MNNPLDCLLLAHESACHPRAARRLGSARSGVALILAVTAFGLCGCKKQAAAPPPPPVVQVADVTATNASRDTEVIGQLDSPQNVEVRVRVEAFVEIIFGTAAEVMQMMSDLPSEVGMFGRLAKEEAAPTGPDGDEMAAACQAGKGQLPGTAS